MVLEEKKQTATVKFKWPVPGIALTLGALSVVAALAICLLTFFSTINSAERQIQYFYMDIAEVVGAQIAGRASLSDQELLALMSLKWQETEDPLPDKYLMVIDTEGRVLQDTFDASHIGTNVAQHRIIGNRMCEPCTLGEIIQTRENYLGRYICSHGQEEIAAFIHAPERDWTIGVHCSRELLRDHIYASLSPLLSAMIIVCGILMPISLFLLYRTFCVAQGRQKQVETELHESEELFRSVVEDLPVMICRTRPDHTILVANKMYCDSFNKTPEEVIGTNALDLIPQEGRSAVLENMSKLTAEHPRQVHEYSTVGPNGSPCYLRWTVRAITNSIGKIVMYQGFGEDITKEKKAQQEREELLSMLDAKNKELQSLVYISSHDLKTPLVNIAGFSGMLKEHCKEISDTLSEIEMDDSIRQKLQTIMDEDVKEDLGFISAGVKQVQMLLDGLLRVSRVGTAEIMPQRLNMNHVLSEIVDLVRFKCEEKGAVITVDSLPDCICDLNQVHQIFTNLLDNALKYLDPQRNGKIQVSGQVQGPKVVYCVEDNGIGIEERYHQKIFDIYYRLDHSGQVEGEGLGLVIIRRILDRYSGKIWVESEFGKGSKFYVSLPYKESL